MRKSIDGTHPRGRVPMGAVFAIVLGVLVVVAILALQAVHGLRIVNRELSDAHEERIAARQVLFTISNAESRARGYLITGDPETLSYYENALDSLESQIVRLKALTQEDTILTTRIHLFEEATRAMVGSINTAIDIRQDQGFDALRVFIRLDRDEALFEEADAAALGVTNAVDEMLRQRTLRAYGHGVRASLTVGMLAAAAIGLLALVYVYVRQNVRKREHFAQALAGMNAELEHRVRLRTEELSASNARLESVVEELQQMNRELSDFAFAASHHFQEPLRKIAVFTGMLENEFAAELPNGGKAYIDRTTTAASRLSRLMRDYVEYTQITAREPSFREVDLTEVVRSVLRRQGVEAIDPTPIVEIEPLPVVYAEAQQMRQLFEQLIGNAVKFRHPDRRLHLRIEDGLRFSGDEIPHQAVVSIADNGIGFEEKYLDRIFTPFQRLHDGTHYDGTGIGLAICRRIVERHKGTINVRSSPGEGSVFTITLPASALPKQAATGGSSRAYSSNGNV